MRGLGIFFLGLAAVMWVANWAFISAHGDISIPCTIIGTISSGAGTAFLFSHWRWGRRQ